MYVIYTSICKIKMGDVQQDDVLYEEVSIKRLHANVTTNKKYMPNGKSIYNMDKWVELKKMGPQYQVYPALN